VTTIPNKNQYTLSKSYICRFTSPDFLRES
jgi:hypothetical protein